MIIPSDSGISIATLQYGKTDIFHLDFIDYDNVLQQCGAKEE